MTTEPTIVRSSSLTSYPGCPRRGAAHMFAKEIKAAGFDTRDGDGTSIAAASGTAVHSAAKIILEEKAKTGELPPVSVSEDAAIEALWRGIEDGVVYDNSSPGIDSAERQVRRMAVVYHYAVAPTVTPLIVEQRLEAEVSGSRQNLVVSGQADVIAQEPDDVRDLKTGLRLGSHAPQIGSYSLIARSHNIPVKGANVDWIQRVSLKKPQPAPAVQHYDLAQAEGAAVAVLDQIDQNLTAFREGDPARNKLPGDPASFPSNPSSMLCSSRYCRCYGLKGPNSFCHDWMPKEAISR